MSDLPEMLRGVIVEGYAEIVQAAGPGEPEPEHTADPGCETNVPNCVTDGPHCLFTGGNTCCVRPHTCPVTGPDRGPDRADFSPALAGWSTPPALDIR